MRKSICTIVLFVCLSPMLKAGPPLPATPSTAIADQKSNQGIQTQNNPSHQQHYYCWAWQAVLPE